MDIEWEFGSYRIYARDKYIVEYVFGPIVNAARGIAVQVQAAINTFIENFQTAIRPQIIKLMHLLNSIICIHWLLHRPNMVFFDTCTCLSHNAMHSAYIDDVVRNGTCTYG